MSQLSNYPILMCSFRFIAFHDCLIKKHSFPIAHDMHKCWNECPRLMLSFHQLRRVPFHSFAFSFPERQHKQQHYRIRIQPVQDVGELDAPWERQLRMTRRIDDKANGDSRQYTGQDKITLFHIKFPFAFPVLQHRILFYILISEFI